MTTVLLFGPLAEIAGTETLSLDTVADTGALKVELHRLYPALAAKRYAIAVDHRMIEGEGPIPVGATVALMPPFSGG